MGLYNNEENRKNVYYNDKKNKFVKLFHDREPELYTKLDSHNENIPFQRKIMGKIKCSNNPNFPEAYGGHMYIIEDSGKIGDIGVEEGNCIECVVSHSIEGTWNDVSKNWIFHSSSFVNKKST